MLAIFVVTFCVLERVVLFHRIDFLAVNLFYIFQSFLVSMSSPPIRNRARVKSDK